MQVLVTCKHGSIDATVHEHIVSKSEKLVTFFERVTAINVTVSFDHHTHHSNNCKVEILVDAEHKHNFVAADEGSSVTSTFDSALHKMEQQIRKYKEKVQDHHRE